MEITIRDLTDDELMRRACDMTRYPKPGIKGSTITRARLLQCMHSPVRLIQFWIEMLGIQSVVSVHLVRHKHGVEPFVNTNRDDRGGPGDAVVTRETLVNHCMLINAEALVNISRKRLCYNAHVKTVAVWRKLRKAMFGVCPATAASMVPECVYRNGMCPELRQCKPGLERVLKAYDFKAALRVSQ